MLLTRQQAAGRLGVSTRHIARLVSARLLAEVRMGWRTRRIRESDLERFVERKTR